MKGKKPINNALMENEATAKTVQEVFQEMWQGCKIHFASDEKGTSMVFYKEDQLFFIIEKRNLWYSRKNVWRVLEKKFSMDYEDIQRFINEQMLERYFKTYLLVPRPTRAKLSDFMKS